MAATSPTEQKEVHGFTVAVGLVLIAAGVGVSPPIYAILTADSIDSTLMCALSWGTSLALLGGGSLLVHLRRRIAGVYLVLLGASCLVSLLAAEGALALLGSDSPYHLVRHVPGLVPWFSCDSQRGQRIVAGKFYKPDWPINRDGFGDDNEFLDVHEEDADVRILFLGDSFGFGVNASAYGKSFVSITERVLQRETRALAWNTAVPGIGQAQQWRSLQTYFPRLAPHVVILAFCTNDFTDNLYPPGAYYVFQGNIWVLRYRIDGAGAVQVLSPEKAYRRAMMAPTKPLDYIALSRVGYLGLCALERIRRLLGNKGEATRAAQGALPPDANPGEKKHGYRETETYLRMMRDYIASRGAHFLLLPIPFAEDLRAPSTPYLDIVALCDELHIDCLEVRERLSVSDYSLADRHWNDAGHHRVAEALLLRLREILELPGSR